MTVLAPPPQPRASPGLGLHASHPPSLSFSSLWSLSLLCTGPTSILVHSGGRGAVLWSWSRSGEWRARDCKFLAVAGALQGTFTRGKFNGLVPQGRIRLLGTLSCKGKDRQWGSGSLWSGMPTLPTRSTERYPGQNSSSALHQAPHSTS